MPAVFNIAAHAAPQAQVLSLLPSAKSAAQHVPPGQARQSAPGAASGPAPFGAGAPMATGAAMPPSAQMPVPAPPPVVSTSQTGALAAAAVNGLGRDLPDRERGGASTAQQEPQEGDEDARPTDPRPTARGLPGGPAPASAGGSAALATPAYGAALSALQDR